MQYLYTRLLSKHLIQADDAPRARLPTYSNIDFGQGFEGQQAAVEPAEEWRHSSPSLRAQAFTCDDG